MSSELESRGITKGEVIVAKLLVAGMLISIIIMIIGALIFVIQQFVGISLSQFLALPTGLKLVTAGGGLLLVFVLVAFFCTIWNRGFKILLKLLYEVSFED